MKVIFLDMDGVLVTQASSGGPMWKLMLALDRACVARLNVLLGAGDILIVISSSWRKHNGVRQIHAHLHRAGLTNCRFHDDWCTVVLDGKTRGAEIDEWLKRHPEVTNFIIVDDDGDFTAQQWPRFVRTNWSDGFTDEALHRATSLLDN